MDNNNGQLILQALICFEGPATASEIVAHVAEISGVRPSDVKDSVEETLKGGVRYGYIQHANRKYFLASVELHDVHSAESESDDGNAGSDDQEERSRRRRRRGGRRRRRSRRRSRR